MLTILTYPPIFKGFLAVLAASLAFPIAGVWIVRLNLLPYRFMLMHGALLGGALALVMKISPLPAVILVNILLVILADAMANQGRMDAGLTSVFLMVTTLGAAMALIYGAGVPAQNALALLWGDVFAVSVPELWATALFCLGLILFAVLYSPKISAVMFDRDLAFSAGVNDKAVMRALLIATALTVAFAMRIVGALLLDALLLVPAITASVISRSLKGLYIRSVIFGLILGVGGFIAALTTDIPVGAASALTGAVLLGGALLRRRYAAHH